MPSICMLYAVFKSISGKPGGSGCVSMAASMIGATVLPISLAGEEEMITLEVEPLGQALELVGTGQPSFVAPVCCNNFRGQFRVAGCNDIIVQLE